MSEVNDGGIRLTVDLPLTSSEAFDAFIEELRSALALDAGIPEEHVPLFAGKSRFLAARKTASSSVTSARSAIEDRTADAG